MIFLWLMVVAAWGLVMTRYVATRHPKLLRAITDRYANERMPAALPAPVYDSSHMLDPTSDETLERWLKEAPASESIVEFAERVGWEEYCAREAAAEEAQAKAHTERFAREFRETEDYWYAAQLEARATETPAQREKREAVQVSPYYFASSSCVSSAAFHHRPGAVIPVGSMYYRGWSVP